MRLVNWLLDLLYPPKCPFCGRILDKRDGGLCDRCQSQLPWTGEEERKMSVDFCDEHLAPLWYRGQVPDAVHRYKFEQAQTYSVVFGALMAQCLADRWDEPVDLITWVPLSQKGLRRRGYDQARLLALRVSELSGIPAEATLKKSRDTKTQSTLSEESARRANVQGAYQVISQTDVAGKRVILVDDVATSGATLSECAACLRLAGAESVAALTLARARK